MISIIYNLINKHLSSLYTNFYIFVLASKIDLSKISYEYIKVFIICCNSKTS